MNIYLVRHGDVHNVSKIFYERIPRFKLSQKGVSEIERTAQYLLDKNIHYIYASPLLRTRQTAKIIQQHLNLPQINLTKKIIEIKSSFRGKPFTFLRDINFDFFFSSQRDISDETMEQVLERMYKFIGVVVKRHPGKNIVIVTHGDPIMILKAHMEGLPLTLQSIRPAKYIENGEVFLISGDTVEPLTIKSVFIPQE